MTLDRREAPETPYRVILAGICALVLTVGLARFAYTPMLPIMKAQAGLGYVAAGWLAAINYAGYMAGTMLAASAGDLRRRYMRLRWTCRNIRPVWQASLVWSVHCSAR